MGCMRLLLVTCRMKDESEQNFYLKTDATEQETIEAQASVVMPSIIPNKDDVSHIAIFETAFLFMKAMDSIDLSGY